MLRTLITFSCFIMIVAHSPVFAQESAPSTPKAVLVTGASSGIGFRMTEVLSQNGFLVYAGARSEADIKRLEAMENVEAVRLDVTHADDISAAVELVKAKGRGLYGLINNAGLSIFGPMSEVPEEQLDFLFDVNVHGPYRVTQAFLPLLKQSQGRLLTTGSIAGSGVSPMMGHYSMSKFAVEAMTDAWAQELARYGIQVGVIEPGSFGTNIGNAAHERLLSENYWSESTQYPEERAAYLEGLTQFDKGADPLPVAQAALDFMSVSSPKARYMVTPNQEQATRIIQRLLNRAVQQNHAHPFSLDREQMIKMLNEEMDRIESSKAL